MNQLRISNAKEGGLSIVGFLFVIIILALVAVLGMKVVPTVLEYSAVKKAIANAKNAGSTPREIQDSFEKQRATNYVESITGRDLDIVKTSEGFDVTAAYQKKIELVGPVSLVIDYVATTGAKPAKKVE